MTFAWTKVPSDALLYLVDGFKRDHPDQKIKWTEICKSLTSYLQSVQVDGGQLAETPTHDQCKQHYRCVKPGLHRGPWSNEEDRTLLITTFCYHLNNLSLEQSDSAILLRKLLTEALEVMRQDWNFKGNNKELISRILSKENGKLYEKIIEGKGWAAISEAAGGLKRSCKHIQQRWHVLNPFVRKRQIWSAEEDDIYLKELKTVGKKWAVIARQLPGRSPDQVKRHYKCVEAKLACEQQTGSSPPAKVPSVPSKTRPSIPLAAISLPTSPAPKSDGYDSSPSPYHSPMVSPSQFAGSSATTPSLSPLPPRQNNQFMLPMYPMVHPIPSPDNMAMDKADGALSDGALLLNFAAGENKPVVGGEKKRKRSVDESDKDKLPAPKLPAFGNMDSLVDMKLYPSTLPMLYPSTPLPMFTPQLPFNNYMNQFNMLPPWFMSSQFGAGYPTVSPKPSS